MFRTARNATYRLFGWLEGIAIFLMAIIGGALKLNETDLTGAAEWIPAFPAFVEYIQPKAWWLLVALGAIAGLSKIICTKLVSPWARKAVQSVIDELRGFAFKADGGDPAHYHRVTLFKRVPFKLKVWPWRSHWWPWGKGRGPFSGWLIPVARSGHTTQRTKTVFLAPDDADSAEGLAGLAWSCNEIVYKMDLPNIENNPTAESVKTYSRETGLSPGLTQTRVEAGLPAARSYLAMGIEVGNKKWGVLVLDSRHPDGIKKPTGRDYVMYSVMAKFLGRLLERA